MDRFSEGVVVLDQIAPAAARNTGSYATDWVDMRKFPGGVMAILQVGTLAGTGTVTGTFQSASTSAGGGSATIASASMVTSTFASTDNGEIGVLDYQASQDGTFVGPWIRFHASVATSNGWVGAATLLGRKAIYEPGSNHDDASVTSLVVYPTT